jgi:dTDP-4-amino-4,6-dideoxygalactose transaminase
MYKTFPSSSPTNLPIAMKASREVLCLPIYPGIALVDQVNIASTIAEFSQ